MNKEFLHFVLIPPSGRMDGIIQYEIVTDEEFEEPGSRALNIFDYLSSLGLH